MGCGCQCSVSLSQGALGWTAVCDCGIFCSYSYFLEIASIPRSQFYPQIFVYLDLKIG